MNDDHKAAVFKAEVLNHAHLGRSPSAVDRFCGYTTRSMTHLQSSIGVLTLDKSAAQRATPIHVDRFCSENIVILIMHLQA